MGKIDRQNNEQRVCLTNLSTDEALTSGQDIQTLQMEDEEISPVLGWLANSSNRPTWSVVAPHSRATKILWAQWDSLRILGNKLPTTKMGNKYLLVAMDYFTKWPEAYPLPNQEASTVANVLVHEFVCRLGTPLELRSDQGRNFE